MKQYLFTFFISVILLVDLSAQQIGSWRMHFRSSTSKHLAYSTTKIMSATNEFVMLYDYTDKSIRELDKSNALSDIGISALAYCKDEKTFVIAYNSSNIDLLTDELVITNMPDLKNKTTSVSKTINSIFIYGSKAYFSTDLGIVVLDIPNQEIDNTYIIGNGGNPVQVLDCTILNDTIYALTSSEGLKSAPLNGTNLLDFSNWNFNSVPSGDINFIETFEEQIYLVTDLNTLYKKNGANWDMVFTSTNATFRSLTTSEKLVAIYENDSSGVQKDDIYLIIENNTIDTIKSNIGSTAQLGIYINANDLYIGDFSHGLRNYSNSESLNRSGKPFGSNVYKFSSQGNRVFAAAGSMSKGIVAAYNNQGFYYFEENTWKNINKYNVEGLNEVKNFVDVKENTITGKIYGATTEGLVEYDYSNITVYDHSNSIIEKQFSGGSHKYITGVDFDAQGNIWMVNSQTNEALIILTKNGEWYKYPLSFGGNKKYHHLFVDNQNQKWVALRGSGISVFPSIEDLSANHDADAISLTISSANLPNSNVNTIVEDKNGSIWAGTDEGIAVFDCPENIFDATSDCMVSRRIKSTLDEYTEYLFDTDIVNTIVVDGANRKWVGTSSGAYLLSASGDEVLLSFNTDNSPLPSNEVISIGIQEQSGEVFIGTSLGIASYVSDATEPAEDISNIKAFPNPIRPDYNGTISVTGLVAESYVKITDINGVLIHDGYALGGKFVWDGKSYNGVRARSGVYLVFSSDNKSKNKAVAKIVFIN